MVINILNIIKNNLYQYVYALEETKEEGYTELQYTISTPQQASQMMNVLKAASSCAYEKQMERIVELRQLKTIEIDNHIKQKTDELINLHGTLADRKHQIDTKMLDPLTSVTRVSHLANTSTEIQSAIDSTQTVINKINTACEGLYESINDKYTEKEIKEMRAEDVINKLLDGFSIDNIKNLLDRASQECEPAQESVAPIQRKDITNRILLKSLKKSKKAEITNQQTKQNEAIEYLHNTARKYHDKIYPKLTDASGDANAKSVLMGMIGTMQDIMNKTQHISAEINQFYDKLLANIDQATTQIVIEEICAQSTIIQFHQNINNRIGQMSKTILIKILNMPYDNPRLFVRQKIAPGVNDLNPQPINNNYNINQDIIVHRSWRPVIVTILCGSLSSILYLTIYKKYGWNGVWKFWTISSILSLGVLMGTEYRDTNIPDSYEINLILAQSQIHDIIQ